MLPKSTLWNLRDNSTFDKLRDEVIEVIAECGGKNLRDKFYDEDVAQCRDMSDNFKLCAAATPCCTDATDYVIFQPSDNHINLSSKTSAANI